MSDFRIRYGLALGPYGTLSTTSANNTFASGDTTPDVSLGTFFLTNNTSATVYTFFDGIQQGGVVGAEEGKLIVIRTQDANTTLVNGGRLFLAESGGALRSGAVIGLVHSNSAWYEVFRSGNQQGVITAQNIAGTMAPNVDGVQTLVLSGTAAGGIIVSFSGGVMGQIVSVVQNSGQAVNFTTGGNIRLANTSDLIVNISGAYQFIKRADNVWSVFAPALP